MTARSLQQHCILSCKNRHTVMLCQHAKSLCGKQNLKQLIHVLSGGSKRKVVPPISTLVLRYVELPCICYMLRGDA